MKAINRNKEHKEHNSEKHIKKNTIELKCYDFALFQLNKKNIFLVKITIFSTRSFKVCSSVIKQVNKL